MIHDELEEKASKLIDGPYHLVRLYGGTCYFVSDEEGTRLRSIRAGKWGIRDTVEFTDYIGSSVQVQVGDIVAIESCDAETRALDQACDRFLRKEKKVNGVDD